MLNAAIAAALFNLIYDYLLSQRVKWYSMLPWRAPLGQPVACSEIAPALALEKSWIPRSAPCGRVDLMNHSGTVEVRSASPAGACRQHPQQLHPAIKALQYRLLLHGTHMGMGAALLGGEP